MSDIEIILTEQCGSAGNPVTYAKKGQNGLIRIRQKTALSETIQIVLNFFREIFLPYGYPESVSEDYFQYQLWDTVQAFCSTITGAFTTRAILKGIGVGDSQASALSAAVTWIIKEGTGMIGRIMFAWWKGNDLDSDCKKWRLFADILNDMAMIMDLFLPYISNISMQILCITSAMKSIVGIAGGATRASITHHQAIKDNTAEVSAKDATQETLVSLVASILSLYLLGIFNESVCEWVFIMVLIGLHIISNYLAVKSLVFKAFNDQRMAIILKIYLNYGIVLNPQKINEKEAVFLGYGVKVSDFCGFKIFMGESLKYVAKQYSTADLQETLSLYENKDYLLLCDIYKKRIFISFEKETTTDTIIAAYFHTVCLAIATCIYNGIDLDIYSKRQLHHPTPITRLYTFMKSFERSNTSQNIPYNHLIDFEEFVKQEYSMFYTALQINGWKLDTHYLTIGEWRTEWKSYNKKQL